MSIYQVSKLTDNLYSIKEDITNNKFPILIYLVIGTKKAALIDTGLGTDNLRETVELITKLPIIVLHSHVHMDHVGADALFDEIYLNLREYGLEDQDYNFSETLNQRLNYIEANLKDNQDLYAYVKSHLVESKKINYKNIDDGDIIDLGGINLEAISTPGHTLGSMSFVNKRDHYAFTGDGIADIHWFDNEESISVQKFLNTLNHFEEKAKGVRNIYAAHLTKPFTLELVHDLQSAAESIINGSDDKIENADYQFLIHGDLYTHRCGDATIYYNKENIYYKSILPSQQIHI